MYFFKKKPRIIDASGVARGTGWQHIGAYANIGSYYLAGIPLGSFLCFVVKLRGKGLWIGILIGSTLQTIVLAVVTFFTSWEQEVYVCFYFILINYSYDLSSCYC